MHKSHSAQGRRRNHKATPANHAAHAARAGNGGLPQECHTSVKATNLEPHARAPPRASMVKGSFVDDNELLGFRLVAPLERMMVWRSCMPASAPRNGPERRLSLTAVRHKATPLWK